MLKRILEEFLEKEIFDIDEVIDQAYETIGNTELDKINNRSLRGIRNYFYGENYYNKSKRLYYLVNELGIDYQPRVLLLVEGETEKKVIPKIWEWYFGNSIESSGIEIMSYDGVSNLFGKEHNFKHGDDPKTKLFANNFIEILSFNLDKFQIIPFILGDFEGDVKNVLLSDRHKVVQIRLDGGKYEIPINWRYFWGFSDDNQELIGKDFEFANFTDEEIQEAINCVINNGFELKKIAELRNGEKGIKALNREEICGQNKVNIGLKLWEILQDKLDIKEVQSEDRPIFGVLEKIRKIAILNHQPKSLFSEKGNKEEINKILSE